ncbi:MAG: UvrD-helicase domain-containing protein [Armatimonadota bacterium]
MTLYLSRADEERRIAHVQAVIAQKIDDLLEQGTEDRAELQEYRRYIVESVLPLDLEDPANLTERMNNDYIADVLNTKVANSSREIDRLKRLHVSPYFGRIDVLLLQHGTEEMPVYIGLSSLWEGEDHLIYDWRTPIAGLFYDYGLGAACYTAQEGEIAVDIRLKRQYRFRNSRLELMFENDVVIDDELLQEALAQHATDRMKNIVTTIQREQNRAIRDEEAKYLLILGPAGSGKTSIALHRAAYLLYRYRAEIKPENIMILSPSELFSDYIANVLPELGEENILRFTFDDIAEYAVGEERRAESKYDQLEYLYTSPDDAPFRARAAGIRFKGGFLLLELIYRYADHLAATLWRFRNVSINGKLVCSAGNVKELFDEHCAGLPLVKAGEKLIDMLSTLTKVRNDQVILSLQRQVQAMIAETDVVALYRRLMASPDLLRSLCPPDRELPAEIEDICRFTANSLDGEKLLYEDIAPMLLLEKLLSGRETKKPVDQILIDEVQDYTPIQLEYIRKQFPGVNITALGDPHQAINPCLERMPDETFRLIFTGGLKKTVGLTKSYRSTKEIASFARSMVGGQGVEIEDVRRGGEKPRLVRVGDRKELFAIYGELLKAQPEEDGPSIAFICKSARRAREVYLALAGKHPDLVLIRSDMSHFHTGQVVIPVYLAKGLEYDIVVIDDAGEENYDQPWYDTILYTACTRAMQKLVVTCVGELSPVMGAVDPELYTS